MLLLFPAYFADVVPPPARLYGAGDASPIRMFFNAQQLIAPLAIAFIVLAARLWRWRQEPLVDVLLLFGLSAFAIYFLQNKGWAYHRLPADAAFTFLFAYWLIVIIASSPAHQTKAASFAIAGTAVALGFLGAAILEKQKTDIESVVHYDDSAENWLTKLIQRQGAHSIMALSQMLSPPF